MIAPLELLLPSGVVRRVQILGAGAVGGLAFGDAEVVDARADLVLITPSRDDLRQPGWLPRAISGAVEAAVPEGAVYVVLPRRRRGRARRLLRQAGLSEQVAITHLPANDPRYLVPLEREAWKYAFAQMIGSPAAFRLAARLTMRVPLGASLLRVALPGLGILARRPEAPALAAWVRAATPQAPAGSAVAARSWRGSAGAVTLHCIGARRGDAPVVVKATPGFATEAETLRRFGVDAEAAGARVPRVLAQVERAGSSIVVQSFVGGTPAARAPAARSRRRLPVVQALVAWLAAWNARTAAEAVLDAAYLERCVLAPFDAVEPTLRRSQPYGDFLRRLCDRVEGTIARLVAAHNDLTMWNVLVDRRGHIGIIDWATADSASLPLTDFFYAVVDAHTATGRYPSRHAAAAACFGTDGSPTALVAPLQRQLLAAVPADAAIVELSYHACWLHHARNDLLAGDSDGEFVHVLQAQADLLVTR